MAGYVKKKTNGGGKRKHLVPFNYISYKEEEGSRPVAVRIYGYTYHKGSRYTSWARIPIRGFVSNLF